MTDPLGNVTQFVFDDLDRLVEQVDPLGRSSFFEYDAVGNQIQSTDRKGRTTYFEYDPLHRLTQETWSESVTTVREIQFTYDPASNMLSASDADSSYAFTYDPLNRPVTESNAGTPGSPEIVLAHAYDDVGNRLSVTDNLGAGVQSVYDNRDLLVQRTWQGAEIDSARVEFDYDGRANLFEIRRFDSIASAQPVSQSTYSYDPSGRLTELQHLDALGAVFADYDYVYDLADQVTQETHHGDSFGYTYDPLGQLTETERSNGPDESFSYDANGSRIGAGLIVGPNNQITSDDVFDYSYDDEGNLVTKTEVATGEVAEYKYDHRNRLTQVHLRSAVGVLLSEASYTYDVFNRRIAKLVDPDGSGPISPVRTSFVYDGEHIWAEFDGSDDVINRFLFSEHIDDVLARYRPGEGTVWHLTDRQGTVRDQIDSTGDAINHTDYGSFGNVLSETNPDSADRFKYTGREFDIETGLHYFRSRYYDATQGRFITEDPIGFDGGDLNLYRYVGNSPPNFTDPFGTTATTERTGTQETTAVILVNKADCFLSNSLQDITIGTLLGGPALTTFDVTFNIVSCNLLPTSAVMNVKFVRVSGELALKLKQAITNRADVAVELAGKYFKGKFATSSRELVPYYPPNRGFLLDPVSTTLKPGARLSRYGGFVDQSGQFKDFGTFVAPEGVPFRMRALPPSAEGKPLSVYEVLKPIDNVSTGKAAPGFNQPGLGSQQELPLPIQDLVEQGFLRLISRIAGT